MSTLQEYKCPECGGAIGFDSQSQKMKCPYCDTVSEVSAIMDYNAAVQDQGQSEMNWQNQSDGQWSQEEQSAIVAYSCQSCGGEIVGDRNTTATSCPFCGNPVVITGNVAGALRPDLVIPFKLDKAAAMAGFSKHLKGKRLLPKVFKDQNRISEIKGVYVPFWLFDADADAAIHYKATKIHRWSDSQYNYTETNHYHLYREGLLGFNLVPVDGSTKMADELMESIEPFDYSQVVDFQTAYLAGYFADKHDVDAANSQARANQRIQKSVETTFSGTAHGYNTVVAEQTNIQLKNGTVRHALLPVWLLNTKWNGKDFTFAMNGQTGKFVGNLPLDRGAYWRWFGLVSVITAAVAFGAQLLIGMM